MTKPYDLICLSHLRWDFVFQRPQHLLNRCARQHRVFFVEEPVIDAGQLRLAFTEPAEKNVFVLTPHLPAGLTQDAQDETCRQLLREFLSEKDITNYICWYYTPMMTPWTKSLTPQAIVYDCMDELSAFSGAPPALREREAGLLEQADLVFTGGQSLYEAKRGRHRAVYAFPSSVEVPFFAQARTITEEPPDQKDLPHPRLGFYGVIDERLDVALLAGVAELRPNWHWVIIGPVVSKIDPATLPQRPNIHYLGGKKYAELPSYLAGWDAALLLFARNESTRFISPTKTPEYLAAGRPVVSTSIQDVIRPYGEQGLAHIADAPEEFVAACELALSEDAEARQKTADTLLSQMSWDKTWGRMAELIDTAIADRK